MSEPTPELRRAPQAAREPLPYKEPLEGTNEAKLDDVMMAMDVVDTLRHERMMIVRDVNSEVRAESLVDRLRDIYRGQGIEVPDDILMDGVKALEEERFRYSPPKPSFGTRLAYFYINRRRWLPALGAVFGIVMLAAGISAAYERTESLETTRIERALDSLPAELEGAYQTANGLAADAQARTLVGDAFAEGEAALQLGDVAAAQASVERLESLARELNLSYDLEVVSRPGQLSGIDRFADGGGTNYYLIVEGVTPSGQTVERDIVSEETGRTERVDIWGQRVTKDVYDQAVADKRADGIVDEGTLGTKDRGTLAIDYTSGDYSDGVLTGTITDW